MEISDKTKDFIIELNDFSGNKIKNIYEISYLFELSSVDDNNKLFRDIIFTAKYLNGLGKIMQENLAAPPNGEASEANAIKKNSAEKVKEEYKNNIQHFVNQIKFFLQKADDNFKKEFDEKFLSLNRTSMVKLTTLVYDLSWVKKFLNRRENR